jgi:ABC-type cobalamin/Fe3+-siderophores transport system ATPase subunit
MIQVRNLQKSFRGRHAVADASFDAPDGSINGILGANGAGKTTILRAIGGILRLIRARFPSTPPLRRLPEEKLAPSSTTPAFTAS